MVAAIWNNYQFRKANANVGATNTVFGY